MTFSVAAWIAVAAAAGGAALILSPTVGAPDRGIRAGRGAAAPTDSLRRRWKNSRARRRAHAEAVTALGHLVGLVSVGVEAGAPVAAAVTHACEAHGGPLAGRLRAAAEAIAWGSDPAEVWEEVASEPALASLGRALARSARTGASIVRTLEVVADDLAAQSRAAREDAARQVGVRAAVPLGVCLLPAFLLLGIVPLVAGMAVSLLP